MNRSLFYLFSICLIAVGCGNLQVNHENEIEKAKSDMDSKIISLTKNVDSCFVNNLQEEDTSVKEKNQVTYDVIKETSNYLDSLRRYMNSLNTLDVSNMELVTREFGKKGLFDSVLNKTNKSYLAVKELMTSDQRKFKIDSIVNDLNTKFRHETFEAWTPIAMSSVLFSIDSNLLSISTTCTWTK
jgi:hypothetical protein